MYNYCIRPQDGEAECYSNWVTCSSPGSGDCDLLGFALFPLLWVVSAVNLLCQRTAPDPVVQGSGIQYPKMSQWARKRLSLENWLSEKHGCLCLSIKWTPNVLPLRHHPTPPPHSPELFTFFPHLGTSFTPSVISFSALGGHISVTMAPFPSSASQEGLSPFHHGSLCVRVPFFLEQHCWALPIIERKPRDDTSLGALVWAGNIHRPLSPMFTNTTFPYDKKMGQC